MPEPRTAQTTRHDPHLTEDQLNEFLDGFYGDMDLKNIETHLAECVECSSRLDELESLFASLIALPDKPLSIDLAPKVLAKIRPRFVISSYLKWGAALQVTAALALLLVVVPVMMTSPWMETFQLAKKQILIVLQSDWTRMLSQWSTWIVTIEQNWSQTWIKLLNTKAIPLAQIAIWPLFLSAGLLWLVGNGLILQRVNQNSHIS